MTRTNSYSLQRTMIIYMLLIGFAALLVASEFVLDTHSTSLKKELSLNCQRYASGALAEGLVYEPLVKIRNKAMMMVGVILAVVVIVLTRLLSAANLELALGILTLTTAFIFVSAIGKYTDTGQDKVAVKQARRCGWPVSLMAVASGMLSVSIGEWLVPLMRNRLKVRMRVAVATSIVTIFGTCIAGSALHVILGSSADLTAFVWAVPGVIIGGQIGLLFTEKINERILKEVFVFLLTLIGIHLIYNSY